jgi:ribosomal protein S18 acetylase RimI-like enzyme
MNRHLDVLRVDDEWGRQQALAVMRSTYRDEKNWIADDGRLVAPSDLSSPDISWFVVRLEGQPVGVLRVLYAPPLDLYAQYGFQLVRHDLDLDAFIRSSRIAEIGRFAVSPDQRSNFLVATALMREAVRETVQRGFTHYITDVFEGETHSPFTFHSRVLGFETVATHDVGELNCPNRRITMVLDLAASYRRLSRARGWLYRYLTEGWTEAMRERMESRFRLPAEAS